MPAITGLLALANIALLNPFFASSIPFSFLLQHEVMDDDVTTLDFLVLADCCMLAEHPMPPQLLLVHLGGHAEAELPQGSDVVLEDEGVGLLEVQLDGVGQVGGLAEK